MRDNFPFDTLSSETLRKAEEMCAGLSTNLSLDRRGRARQYAGALADLDRLGGADIPVTVAEISDHPWLTLIADRPIPECQRALLVFRMPPSDNMKYLGRHGASQPGQRGADDQQRHIVQFDILRDARREPSR